MFKLNKTLSFLSHVIKRPGVFLPKLSRRKWEGSIVFGGIIPLRLVWATFLEQSNQLRKLHQERKKEFRDCDDDLGIFNSKMKIAKVTGVNDIT